MATYTIVDKDTDPLGPGEIHAGDHIQVSDGDAFIIDPSVGSNVTFEAAGGVPANFDITFSGSNANNFEIKVLENLTPSVSIPDNANLSDIDFNADKTDAADFTAGNNVTLGKYTGSNTGADTITIGNEFIATEDWDTQGAADVIVIGDNAHFKDIKTGTGDDQFTVGDDASFEKIETEDGNDIVRLGDRATVNSADGTDVDGGKVKTGDGDDTLYLGKNAQANEYDGGGGNDTFNTQTAGTTNKNMETANMVCYAPGTLIGTPDGPRAVETLCPGDLVLTEGHGPQPIRWVHRGDHPLDEVEDDGKPVLIAACSLGKDLPAQDLIVSPQHRILVGGGGQLNRYFGTKAFAPAKSLTKLKGIRHMRGKTKITWIHFACDRHEVVTANGCLSESLLLGPMVVNGLTRAERQTLIGIFGAATQPDDALNGPAAHTCLKVGEARRQIANGATPKHSAAANEIRKWDVDAAMELYEAERLGTRQPSRSQSSKAAAQ